MPEIKLLAQTTIDQIAAGEVVERPASVVKELVENAIDAGSDAVTVEIKEGGIALIRVTDNGCGIPKEQIEQAFLRHATSKIRSAADLAGVQSLGFRGEALSSIAAVAEVEVITKTEGQLTGIRYRRTAGREPQLEEIGVPEGTTFLVRNLFFNVPARKKFLKQAATEGSYITDLMEHMALSRPDIAFKFINNGQTRFHTAGKGDLKEVVYRIYGREVTESLIPIPPLSSASTGAGSLPVPAGGIELSGFLGKPELNRANRNFEFFFVNGRYIKSTLLTKSLEEGYRPFLMQHKFPFAVLQVRIDPELIDVNVHPAKMEIRFTGEKELTAFLSETIRQLLSERELIPSTDPVNRKPEIPVPSASPEPFEFQRIRREEKKNVENEFKYAEKLPNADIVVEERPEYKLQEETGDLQGNHRKMQESLQNSPLNRVLGSEKPDFSGRSDESHSNVIKAAEHILVERPTQMNFFEDKFLSHENKTRYEVLGQIFGTYWLVLLGDRLVFIDQHAAHEKVKYESLLRELQHKSESVMASQLLSPPAVLPLNGAEEEVLRRLRPVFTRLGFEIDDFGIGTYLLRGVPAELNGCQDAALFREILDEMGENQLPEAALSKLARAACKAAVKGNRRLKREEFEALVAQLIELENPYFCPHGRPTMIAMSKNEIEKRFKRT